jgi:TolA-binding protein
MTKGRIALLFIAAMVFLSVGFVIGQIVQAAGTIPGTSGDPLVAKSYVEKVVNETVSDLQSKLDEMESKVLALEEMIGDLSSGKTVSSSKGNAQSNSSSNSGSSGSNSKSSTTGTDREPDNGGGSSVKGKTAEVSGSSANVRTGPGTSYERITTLVQGDTVTLILEENSWYKVTLSDGQEGWIANWLLKVK